MPQAARNWAETGALLCEVLAAELEQHRQSSPRTALGSAAAPSQSSETDGPSMQHPACSRGISSGMSEARRGAAPLEPGQCPALPETPAGRGSDRAVGSMPLSAQVHLADGPGMSSRNAASSGNADRPRAHIDWPEVVPAEQAAQSTGHMCMSGAPEPPAEFASVLCATWHALAPEAIRADSAPARTQAAAQEQRSSMPSSLQAQRGNDHGDIDEQGAELKRLRMAPPSADIQADPGSTWEAGTAPAGTGREGLPTGQQQALDPPRLGLDFRLLGEPAGFTSCCALPSSRPALQAALVSELGSSGPSLFIHVLNTGDPSPSCL